MIEIYTDGACSPNPGPGGWGVYIEHDDKSIELFGSEKDSTNNRMEMMGFLKGIKYVLLSQEPAKIFVDSNYVYGTVTKWHKNWKKDISGNWYKGKHEEIKNLSLWLEILEVYHKIEHLLTIEKVKGHSTNLGNNIADALAVKGRMEGENESFTNDFN